VKAQCGGANLMKLKMKTLKILSLLMLTAAVAGCALSSNAAPASGKGKILYYKSTMMPGETNTAPGKDSMGMDMVPVYAGQTAVSGAKTGVPAGKPAGKGKILYYKSTMIPGQISQHPGKDSMGMDMVPMYQGESSAPGNPSAVSVDPVTMQDMDIVTTPVVKGPLRRVIRTVGTIDYNETTLADVTTKFNGWIEKLYVNATGDLVMKGDPLFEIYSPELYSAEVEYLLATDPANKTGAGGESLKASALTKLKFFDISDSQIAELDKTRQPRKTLRILAPQDGFVVEKNVVEGQMVEAGKRIYRLADLGIVWVLAQVYEQDLPYIRLGQEATVTVSYLPDREFRGRVTYIYPNVDEKTRTAKVRMEFHNPGYFLKPGMFVSARITSELNPSVLLIPDSAILRSGEKNTVFVALPGGKFEPRAVVLGPAAEHDMYQAASGLDAGERVVTSGEFMLDSESQLREAIQKMLEPAGGAASKPPPANGSMGKMNMSEAAPAPSTNAMETNVVYVCPMPAHVSITYNHPGKCPICGMTLVPVTPGELNRLQPGGKVLYYTCPMPEHSYIHENKPGKCPICGMTLIPVMEGPPLPMAHAPAGNESMPQGMAMPQQRH
jgi:membrane fusion protein, copper/silver efflux system